MVFITVLVAASFVSIILIACLTLVTLAARTTSWSSRRTAALYAAEAGIGHWLFEAATEVSEDHHEGRHSYPGGHGHGHGSGHRRGHGPWDGGLPDLSTLEVTGEVNGVSYVTYVDSYSVQDSAYRLVSIADSFPRDVTVSVNAGATTAVWRHVLYAREVDDLLALALQALGLSPCDLSGVDPAGGGSGPVLWNGDGQDPFPVPDWEHYRAAIAPQLDGWEWPKDHDARNRNLGSVFTPAGSPPFFYEKVTAGTIRGPVNGDIYLKSSTVDRIEGLVNGSIYIEECSVGEIAAQVQGSIYIRDLKQSYGVGRIKGTIAGSVCILCPNAQGGEGTPDSYQEVTFGGRDASSPIGVGGSIYVRGREVRKGGHDRLPFVVSLAGPESSPSVVQGGVFAEDASVYLLGSVQVCRDAGSAWPAILSRGVTLLNSAGESIVVNGPVYSQAGDVYPLDELLEEAADDAGWSHPLPELFGAALDWLGHSGPNPGFVAIRRRDGTLPNEVVVNGNIVSPGMPIITGGLTVDYDEALLDPGNHPPYFTGGKAVVALTGGTWSLGLGDGGQGR